MAMGVLEKNVARWQSGKPIFKTSFATGKVAKWQSCKVAKLQSGKVAKWQWGFWQWFAKIWQSGNATILAYADAK